MRAFPLVGLRLRGVVVSVAAIVHSLMGVTRRGVVVSDRHALAGDYRCHALERNHQGEERGGKNP